MPPGQRALVRDRCNGHPGRLAQPVELVAGVTDDEPRADRRELEEARFFALDALPPMAGQSVVQRISLWRDWRTHMAASSPGDGGTATTTLPSPDGNAASGWTKRSIRLSADGMILQPGGLGRAAIVDIAQIDQHGLCQQGFIRRKSSAR
jgi:hypothetical protein